MRAVSLMMRQGGTAAAAQLRNLLRMPVCVQRGGVVGCHSQLPAIAALHATAATATALVLDATGRI